MHNLSIQNVGTHNVDMQNEEVHNLNIRNKNRFTLTLTTPAINTKAIDYRDLINKPSIEDVVLVGGLTLDDFGIPDLINAATQPLSNYELDIITRSATSEEALQYILSQGGETQLGGNLSVTGQITIDNNAVFDLNTFTLTSNVDECAIVADGVRVVLTGGKIIAEKCIAKAINGGEIVVKSGTFVSHDEGFSAVGAGSKITFDGGKLISSKGISAFDGAFIEIKGGLIISEDGLAVFTDKTEGRGGNTITMSGGEIESNVVSEGYESCGVYLANNDTFTMNGGTIRSNNGCGILMRAGGVIINDGEVIAMSGSHTPGLVGDNDTQMSASAIIYHESANYPGRTGMYLEIGGGVFVGADKAIKVLTNEPSPSIIIVGGSFTPAVP